MRPRSNTTSTRWKWRAARSPPASPRSQRERVGQLQFKPGASCIATPWWRWRVGATMTITMRTREEGPLQIPMTVETRSYPLLSGVFLVLLAVALVLVSYAVGTESYPYIHRPVTYRFTLATLDRVYLIALAVLAVHYAAYVVHYLTIGSRQTAAGPMPVLVFSPTKFVITWFFLCGLAGVYAVGASIATPALFDAAFGPARETAFLRVWHHTYFGFVLLCSILAGILYLVVTSAREHGPAGAF